MESRALASCRCQQGRLLSGGVVTWGGGADGMPGCRGGELVTWQHAVGPRRVAPFGALVRLFAFGFSRFGCLLDVLRGARGVAAWASGQHGEAPVRRKDARRWWARSGECVGGAHFPWRAPRPCGCSSPVASRVFVARWRCTIPHDPSGVVLHPAVGTKQTRGGRVRGPVSAALSPPPPWPLCSLCSLAPRWPPS